jgi:hypothetical protein
LKKLRPGNLPGLSFLEEKIGSTADTRGRRDWKLMNLIIISGILAFFFIAKSYASDPGHGNRRSGQGG